MNSKRFRFATDSAFVRIEISNGLSYLLWDPFENAHLSLLSPWGFSLINFFGGDYQFLYCLGLPALPAHRYSPARLVKFPGLVFPWVLFGFVEDRNLSVPVALLATE